VNNSHDEDNYACPKTHCKRLNMSTLARHSIRVEGQPAAACPQIHSNLSNCSGFGNGDQNP
jgi:hypothetical protein